MDVTQSDAITSQPEPAHTIGAFPFYPPATNTSGIFFPTEGQFSIHPTSLAPGIASLPSHVDRYAYRDRGRSTDSDDSVLNRDYTHVPYSTLLNMIGGTMMPGEGGRVFNTVEESYDGRQVRHRERGDASGTSCGGGNRGGDVTEGGVDEEPDYRHRETEGGTGIGPSGSGAGGGGCGPDGPPYGSDKDDRGNNNDGIDDSDSDDTSTNEDNQAASGDDGRDYMDDTPRNTTTVRRCMSDDWMLKGHAPGGPIIPSLLRGFKSHIAYGLWDGEVPNLRIIVVSH